MSTLVGVGGRRAASLFFVRVLDGVILFLTFFLFFIAVCRAGRGDFLVSEHDHR